jgi:hypothetical protein
LKKKTRGKKSRGAVPLRPERLVQLVNTSSLRHKKITNPSEKVNLQPDQSDEMLNIVNFWCSVCSHNGLGLMPLNFDLRMPSYYYPVRTPGWQCVKKEVDFEGGQECLTYSILYQKIMF